MNTSDQHGSMFQKSHDTDRLWSERRPPDSLRTRRPRVRWDGNSQLSAEEKALFEAARETGYCAEVRRLLAAGIGVDIRDGHNWPWDQTPLMPAAHNAFLDIVRTLLAAGASVSLGLAAHNAVGVAGRAGPVKQTHESSYGFHQIPVSDRCRFCAGHGSISFPSFDRSVFRQPRLTVRKPYKSLSPKAILDLQTPFVRLLQRLREIAEKRGSDIRQAGRNPVITGRPFSAHWTRWEGGSIDLDVLTPGDAAIFNPTGTDAAPLDVVTAQTSRLRRSVVDSLPTSGWWRSAQLAVPLHSDALQISGCIKDFSG
jgi:hypothetical protein